jgi:hypothetical protein
VTQNKKNAEVISFPATGKGAIPSSDYLRGRLTAICERLDSAQTLTEKQALSDELERIVLRYRLMVLAEEVKREEEANLTKK